LPFGAADFVSVISEECDSDMFYITLSSTLLFHFAALCLLLRIFRSACADQRRPRL